MVKLMAHVELHSCVWPHDFWIAIILRCEIGYRDGCEDVVAVLVDICAGVCVTAALVVKRVAACVAAAMTRSVPVVFVSVHVAIVCMSASGHVFYVRV